MIIKKSKLRKFIRKTLIESADLYPFDQNLADKLLILMTGQGTWASALTMIDSVPPNWHKQIMGDLNFFHELMNNYMQNRYEEYGSADLEESNNGFRLILKWEPFYLNWQKTEKIVDCKRHIVFDVDTNNGTFNMHTSWKRLQRYQHSKEQWLNADLQNPILDDIQGKDWNWPNFHKVIRDWHRSMGDNHTPGCASRKWSKIFPRLK